MIARRSVSLLALLALTGGCAAQPPAPPLTPAPPVAPSAVPPTAATSGTPQPVIVAVRLAGSITVEHPSGRDVWLSPDGTQVVVYGRDRSLCIQAVETAGGAVCSAIVRPAATAASPSARASIFPGSPSLPTGSPAPRNASLDTESVAWSPDSRHIAFTEDWARSGLDSDVWVMDALGGGTPRDLTDDGFAGGIVAARAADAPLDISVGWSPHGSRVLFARVTSDKRTVLMSVPAAGGDAVAIGAIGPSGAGSEERLVTPYGSILAARTGAVYWSAVSGGGTAPSDGLWRWEPGAGAPRQVMGPSREKGPLVLADLSADGATALVEFRGAAAVTFAIVDTRSGTEVPLGAGDAHAAVVDAALSPDGGLVAYKVVDEQGVSLLVRPVSAGGGGSAMVLARDLPADAAGRGSTAGMSWPAVDRLLVPGGLSSIVYRLEAVEP